MWVQKYEKPSSVWKKIYLESQYMYLWKCLIFRKYHQQFSYFNLVIRDNNIEQKLFQQRLFQQKILRQKLFQQKLLKEKLNLNICSNCSFYCWKVQKFFWRWKKLNKEIMLTLEIKICRHKQRKRKKNMKNHHKKIGWIIQWWFRK